MPVNNTHPQYKAHQHQWVKCRTFFEGEAAVKARGELYLPKPEGTTQAQYTKYKLRAFFFNAGAATAEGLTGVIMRKAPVVQLPASLQKYEESIDNEGNSLRAFSKLALNEQFCTGRFGVFAEHTVEEDGRPYLVLYKAEDIINWKADSTGKLQFVVLREVYELQADDDPFDVRECVQYRVLALDNEGYYYQQEYKTNVASTQKSGRKFTEAWNMPAAGGPEPAVYPKRKGSKLTFIPFVFCNTSSVSAKPQRPPLIDLVDKNAELYRVGADFANALYFTGNPIIWGSGIAKDSKNTDLVLNSAEGYFWESADASLHLLEYNGHGLNPARDRWNAILQEIALMGSRMLEQRTAAAETAQAVILRRTGEVSVLTQMVIASQTAIRNALSFMYYYAGGSLEEEMQFDQNMDFYDVTLDANQIAALQNLVLSQLISWDTFYYNLSRGELTQEGISADAEKTRIQQGTPIPIPEPPAPTPIDNKTDPKNTFGATNG